MKLAGHGLLLVLLVLLQGGVAQSREWYVGDQKGWTFGVEGWPNSPTFKPFREGDVLGTPFDSYSFCWSGCFSLCRLV